MAAPNEPIRLDSHDLYSAEVESYLEEREALRRAMPEFEQPSFLVLMLRSTWFYLSIAGMCGGLVGWAIWEPFFNDLALVMALQRGEIPASAIFLFPTVTGMVGLFLGAVEGLMCRNLKRAILSGLVGVGVGFGGGLIALFAAGIITMPIQELLIRAFPNPGMNAMLLLTMIVRSMAWAIIAIPAGLGQGIALRQPKMILNGVLGGVLGGLIGGLLFDPIDFFLTDDPMEAALSRGVGFGCIGLFVGLFVGLVESWTKSSWLLMKAGPLAGKQFVLYKNPTLLGSSPKADIYLFKDSAIEPRHALIHNRGGRFDIEDLDTRDGTYVNGMPVRRQMLQNGDQIVLGETVLEFLVKDTE